MGKRATRRRRGGVIASRSEVSHQEFINAAIAGDVETIDRYLKQPDAEVDVQVNYSNTALILAAFNGHTEAAIRLIKAGANVNEVDYNGNTVLINAAYKGLISVCKYLLDAGADVNAVGYHRTTALITAAYEGHGVVCSILIRYGAALDMMDDDGDTAFTAASSKGHLDCVRRLHRAGADVNSANRDGITALELAAHYVKPDVVSYLISEGADVSVLQREHLNIIDDRTSSDSSDDNLGGLTSMLGNTMTVSGKRRGMFSNNQGRSRKIRRTIKNSDKNEKIRRNENSNIMNTV